jgi:hypothetical protein
MTMNSKDDGVDKRKRIIYYPAPNDGISLNNSNCRKAATQ